MSLILGLVVGGVEVIDTAFQTCLHDGEILIGEGDVDADVRAVTVEKFHQLFD